MTDAPDTPDVARCTPQWLALACLGMLVLPFHTLWVDFEQVRRGLLLVLTGTALLAWPRLPRVRGQRFGVIFVCALGISALVQAITQYAFHDDGTPWSFQTWEAAYRIAHWLALLVLVRIGALLGAVALAPAIATLLLITSAFGLLQHLGLAEIGGYGVEREPVSTLGNLNVASEWTAVAGIAVAVLAGKASRNLRWLAIAALVLACAYLVVNPSRSGKVSMFAGLVLLAIMRRKERGYLPLLLAAAGVALGLLLNLAAQQPQLDAFALQQQHERSTVTLNIRFEIARSATQLFAESPIFGKGPGQFAIEYPRYRSQKEIEASSFERQFPTEVRTAHDDWLELLVDGGLLALVLFASMLFALQRGTRDKAQLLPMFVLLLLMLVRAPIGNAPAAAIAFLMVGSPMAASKQAATHKTMRVVLTVLLALAMFVLGVLPIAGNTAFVPYLRARRDGTQAPVQAAANASWWMPYEPRWLQITAQEALNDGNLQRAAHLSARALKLRPFSPPLLLLLAETLALGQRHGEAIRVTEQALSLDPKNPELLALKSTQLAELGDVDRAIETVVIDPHPVLRRALEDHFADLALRAEQRQELKQAARYLIEYTFVALANRLGTADPTIIAEVGSLNRRLAERIKKLDRANVDTRWLVTGALEALDRERSKLADQYAEAAALRGLRLKPWQAAILGHQLDRLRERPSWRRLLPKPATSGR